MSGIIFKAASPKVVEKMFQVALFALQEQALADCNKFVKVDQHILESSAQADINGTTLILSWNTPYAKRQYYTGRPSKDVNPNASIMWAEVAHDQYGDDWQKIIQKGMGNDV